MRIGLVQPTTGIDPAVEAPALAAAVTELAAQGAQLIFTPEMSGLVDRDRRRAAGHVRPEADDIVLAAVREAARANKVWVHLGSLALAGDGERFANRGFLVDDSGAIRGRYDKIHLFDVTLPGGESYRESAAYAPGDAAVCAATPWGGLGMTICYDVRFPALHAALARAGAVILAVPAAFTRTTGEAHWHILLRARAIETGCFVVAAAQTGTHADGRETFGHSLVVAPWGEIVLDMGTAPGTAVCDIDLAAVAAARGKVPALQHVRAFDVLTA
ncbi:carbon-nitrogen hydrolase family protein [Polymorphobacter fuscus]|uniref:Carbon-nitrogen hydrolase family protein n=1 Tax=Sandarakinorhabdus fusca TaxID=1439888 RepID=A0A7C9KX58_9SPHN|nr:carbon-nitrogen hydrolase family protein [Polymorphobacter fuscus]MQT16686.1 carbon-nitrogen hydrolase family protein [Polymorphobacter fuscus]